VTNFLIFQLDYSDILSVKLQSVYSFSIPGYGPERNVPKPVLGPIYPPIYEYWGPSPGGKTAGA
jgi:hypothetical protein